MTEDQKLVANIASRLYSGDYSREKRLAAINEAALILGDAIKIVDLINSLGSNKSKEDK